MVSARLSRRRRSPTRPGPSWGGLLLATLSLLALALGAGRVQAGGPDQNYATGALTSRTGQAFDQFGVISTASVLPLPGVAVFGEYSFNLYREGYPGFFPNQQVYGAGIAAVADLAPDTDALISLALLRSIINYSEPTGFFASESVTIRQNGARFAVSLRHRSKEGVVLGVGLFQAGFEGSYATTVTGSVEFKPRDFLGIETAMSIAADSLVVSIGLKRYFRNPFAKGEAPGS